MEVYKTIYWLDDAESENKLAGDSETDHITEEWLGKNHAAYIKHEVRYEKALKELETNASEYDLIIFDLNMDKDEFMQHRYKKIKKFFSDVGIITDRFTEKEIKEDSERTSENRKHFIKNAGVYLYLYLALKGYPTDRMIIYTANGEEFIKDAISQSFKLNLENKIIYKDNAQKDGKWIDDFYNNKNKLYYRVRRLVFQACNHWKIWLENEKNEEDWKPEKIPFNHVYFQEETENQISCESFIEMLDRVKMLFPVVRPSNEERVYYQALQMAALFHEESAKIKKVKGFFQPWHSMIRNFRNWGAHNKFDNASLDGEQFAFLFCIALRTFFDEQQINNPNKFSDFYEYEKIFDFKNSYQVKEGEECTEIKADFTKETLEQALRKIWQGLRKLEWENINSAANALNIGGELSNLIWKIPNNYKIKLSKKYLFVPVWCSEKGIRDKVSIDYKDQIMENSVSCTYTSECRYESNTLQKICDKAKKDTPEAVFMCYCYRWLS